MPTVTYYNPTFEDGGTFEYLSDIAYSYDGDPYSGWATITTTDYGYAQWNFPSIASWISSQYGAAAVITGARIVFCKGKTNWSWGAYDSEDNWRGCYATIAAFRPGASKTMLDMRQTGWMYDTSVDLGGCYAYKFNLNSAWWAAGVEFNVRMDYYIGDGDDPDPRWDIYEVYLEVDYTINHGYTTDKTPPTKSTARAIVASNLWNSSTGTFAVANKTTPAVFTQTTRIITPDPRFPDDWYIVPNGYLYLGSVY